LDRTFHLSLSVVPWQMAIVIHLTEVVVHGFDLAVATYQDSMDEGLSEQLPTTNVHGRHGRLPGTRIFGPEVTVSDDAPAPQTAGVVGLGRTICVAGGCGGVTRL
jgi:hypothetical protein